MAPSDSNLVAQDSNLVARSSYLPSGAAKESQVDEREPHPTVAVRASRANAQVGAPAGILETRTWKCPRSDDLWSSPRENPCGGVWCVGNVARRESSAVALGSAMIWNW
jgi:hypothetical protein